MNLLNAVAGSYLVPARLRTLIYKLIGMDVALRSLVSPGVHFRTTRFSLGRSSTVNLRCVFDNRARVAVGERVGIGVDVKFITSTHDLSDPRCRAGIGSVAPIIIEDGA